MTNAKGRPRVGNACCGCTGNLNEPNVKFMACVAGRTIVIACECKCHEGVQHGTG